MSLKVLLVQNIMSALLRSGMIERLGPAEIELIEHGIKYANARMGNGTSDFIIDAGGNPSPDLPTKAPAASNADPVGGATVDRELPQGSRPGVDATTSELSTLIPGAPDMTGDVGVVLDTRADEQGETLSTAVPVVSDGVPPPGAPDYRTLSTAKG